MVTVTGRSANSNWLYVRDDEGNMGFIFAEFLTWPGDVASLRVRDGATAVPLQSGTLTLDIYPLAGTEQCDGNAWTQRFMQAQGVSGTFSYYWEGTLVGTAVNDSVTFEIGSDGGAVVGTGSVISNGITASQDLFIPAPTCNDD
jgi:hypothetical protein